MSKQIRTLNPSTTLEILFNSKIRVKVLKFLFRNNGVNFGVRELSRRIQEPIDLVKNEVRELEKLGLIKKS